MYCDNCGCELGPDMKVCPVCGKKVEDMAADNGNSVRMEDVASQVADVSKNEDIGKELPDISKEANAAVVDTDEMEEEGTTVLKAVDLDKKVEENEDEEGTTVLSADMLKNQGMPMPNPNGMPMPGSNGRPMPGPNGRPMPEPNGMVPPFQPRPMQGQPGAAPQNGIPPFQPRPIPGQPGAMGGMPVNEKDEKKKNKKSKKEKAPKQPKAPKASKEPKTPKQPKEKKGKGGKVALIIILIVVVLALGGGAAYVVPKYLNYNKAEEAYKDGRIDDAVELYKKAGWMKDAETKVNGGVYYEYAASLAEEGNYIDAAASYEKVIALETVADEYKDAADKAKECYFNQAEKLYGEKKYTEAAEYYTKAGDYTGAAEKVKECSYMNGETLAEQKKYDEAVKAYETAGDYKDAADKIKECYYNNASDKMEAKEYAAAKELFLKSEYSDYSDKANECLIKQAEAYLADKKFEDAIKTYGEVDSKYKDCTKKIDSAYTKWGSSLYKSKDYKGAVEKYEQVTKKDVTDKINKAKAAYVKDHKDRSDETTMSYLCDLRYADYGSAEDDYTKLIGWTVESFVNDKLDDYKNKKTSADSSKTIYVHTMYLNENDASMSLKGYVIYSDGTKSNDITFGEVKDRYTTWMSIDPSSAIKGEATLYVYDDTDKLVEKFTFTIK